jgi:hypothetical protein
MKLIASQTARLEFLIRVTEREYIKDLAVLTSALRNGHAFVPTLVTTARRCAAEAQRLLLRP